MGLKTRLELLAITLKAFLITFIVGITLLTLAALTMWAITHEKKGQHWHAYSTDLRVRRIHLLDSMVDGKRKPTTINPRHQENQSINDKARRGTGRSSIHSSTKEIKQTKEGIKLDQLFKAIGTVESGNNDQAIGDGGRSIGRYQIQKAYYQDAIEHRPELKKYKYKEMKNPNIAKRIIMAYWHRYATEWSAEELCRLHNGGPRGPHKEATRAYYQKIRAFGCAKQH